MQHDINSDLHSLALKIGIYDGVLYDDLRLNKMGELIKVANLNKDIKEVFIHYYILKEDMPCISQVVFKPIPVVERLLDSGLYWLLGTEYRLAVKPGEVFSIDVGLEALWMCTRTRNVLISDGYITVRQLVELPFDMINKIYGLNNKMFREIVLSCIAFGFVPKCYNDFISGCKIHRVKRQVSDPMQMTLAEMCGIIK